MPAWVSGNVVGVEVKGLKEAEDNFAKLSHDVQREIGRKASREMGWVLARRMRAATYTTFIRRSGAIREGLGVAVNREPSDNKLSAYVTEYNQSVLGAATAVKTGLRRHIRQKRSVKVFAKDGRALGFRAYWWRFLEFGTAPRRAVRKPTFLVKGKAARSIRQQRAQARWEKSKAVGGGIRPRRWLKPAFSGSAQDAIETYRNTILKLIDAAVSNLPKP